MLGKIMSALGGEGVKSTAETVGNILDKFIETDDEIRENKNLHAKMQDMRDKVQMELNMIYAQSKSFWKAGWRPGFGWLCLLVITHTVIIHPYLVAFGLKVPELNKDHLDFIFWLSVSMLGLNGSMRTFEKFKGISR